MLEVLELLLVTQDRAVPTTYAHADDVNHSNSDMNEIC